MTKQKIDFFYEVDGFKLLDKNEIRAWLIHSATKENHRIVQLNFIFCDDEYLLNINREFLNHDYYTDIITFDNSDDYNKIEGDIFISVDRARDNAMTLGEQLTDEIHRLLVHGLLHLLGYDDKSENDKIQMTLKEDHYLDILNKKIRT